MTTATDHEPGTETFLTAEGGVFTAQALSRALPLYRLTTLQYEVWHTVLGEMTDGGFVALTLQAIADRLATSKSNISPALNRLAELGLLWRVSNGLYRVNPRVAFKGSRKEWNEALQEVPPGVPDVLLPHYHRRPPRTSRPSSPPTG
ncbi:helix-turn-helix domain-containing protein [Kitasatospora sp. NRRL B-11411]|uniref:MarR family transcriptional regulator n=1 Tax=Kitasatospora sp. NRRL B-11411 TaxID=1463822 RepID=UPI0004C36BB4|nr:helix-turn-helix domain-containing protein [Kitasatospora sp. NRRL B-11411]